MRVTITNYFANGGQTTKNFMVNDIATWLNQKIPHWKELGYTIRLLHHDPYKRIAYSGAQCYKKHGDNKFEISWQYPINKKYIHV